MRISDWSSDGCSSDLLANTRYQPLEEERLIRLFLSQSPAALILVGIDQTEGAAELLSAAEQPVAQIMELGPRSEEHTSELQSLMRISYAVFCLKKQNQQRTRTLSNH